MKEFKGTPGPWIKRVSPKGQIMAIIPKKYGERVIERVLSLGQIHDDDCGVETCCCVEEHSNARLIAAAPDLLEALQKIVEFNLQQAEDQYGDRNKALNWACVVTANTAIDKALIPNK